jgi:hypothetical protein
MKSVLRGMQNTATFVSETQDTEGDATTTRPSATAVLAIDSDDRYSNYRQRRNFPTYPFSFNIQKNENILSGFFKRIALTEFRLNWTLPNISVAWGNTALILHYKIGAGNDFETNVILPDGFYNAQEMASELQSQIRNIIPGFQVVISDRDDDTMTFNPPPNYTIFIESLDKPTRELVDMLNVPTQTFLYLKTISGGSQIGNQVLYTVPNGTTGFKVGMAVQVVGITGGTGWNVSSYLTPVIVVAIPSATTVLLQYQTAPTGSPSNFTTGRIDNMYYPVIQSGIPNLRPMDFFDLICNQLSYNQDLKDSSSAPITRDMISRIYLDDSVGSQSIFNTNIYSSTAISSAITSISSNNLDEVVFLVANIANFTIGSQAVISGLVGAVPPATPLANWNTTVEIINIVASTGTTGYIDVIYPVVPGGVPTDFTSAIISSYSQTSFSTPQTTWDDRVNGVSPFVIYRQFPYPKQIRWNNKMPIGNLTFELYDDQGRNIQDLWNSAYPPATPEGLAYANSFVWNATMLISED